MTVNFDSLIIDLFERTFSKLLFKQWFLNIFIKTYSWNLKLCYITFDYFNEKLKIHIVADNTPKAIPQKKLLKSCLFTPLKSDVIVIGGDRFTACIA